jgi:hypothetical protein
LGIVNILNIGSLGFALVSRQMCAIKDMSVENKYRIPLRPILGASEWIAPGSIAASRVVFF